MDIRKLTPTYYVSPQIAPADMEALREAGFTTILCNRPDVEVPPSHCADTIRKAAEEAGIAFAEFPLTHQSMVPDAIAENRALGADCDGMVLAYCASGTRSTIAWALGQAGKMPADEIIAAAHEGGYDISNMQQVLGQTYC
jgi:uncharacterized protein (TIGR01244 family)